MEEHFRYLSQSIQRTIDVLFAFTPDQPELGLTELTEALDLPKSTVHRAIANLEVRGLLERDEATGKYRLGLKIFELGMRARGNMELREIARPHLKKVANQTDENVTLAIFSDDEVLYLDVVQSSKALRAASAIGQRRPIHCTAVGKVLLAGLPPHEIARIAQKTGLPARTQNTITDSEELIEDVLKVRKQNYALDLGEFEEGLCCIAAPIMDEVNAITASIAVAGPLTRFNEEVRPEIIELMQTVAQAISHDLGYRGSLIQEEKEIQATESP